MIAVAKAMVRGGVMSRSASWLGRVFNRCAVDGRLAMRTRSVAADFVARHHSDAAGAENRWLGI